jgi:glycosyltransferase involved in cell wall biosynthesis
MRVLILSQYYYPEPVEKVHDLARGLVRLGHEVQVVTGFPCYPKGQIYAGYRQTLVLREYLDGVKVMRVPQLPDHSRSSWRRGLYYLSFALSAAMLGTLLTQPADVVLVYQAALPVGLSGWIVSRLRGMPLVLDVVDLWPESVIASGMLQNKLVVRLLQRIANFVYEKSDHINVVTEGFRRTLLKMGVPQEQMTVIHNWMPAETYDCVAPDLALAEREGLAKRFNVMYAGNMGPSQDLRTVIEAAALLADLPQVQLVLVGDGVQYSELVEFLRKKGLRNVLFLGRRPPESMPALYALADVLLVHLKPDSLSDVSIPSKVFAYMASGRPVLTAVKGDAEQFVVENGFGVAVPPSNPAKMAEAVRWFYGASHEKREEMGKAALVAYKTKYSPAIQIGRVEAVLAKVINRQNRQAR